MAAACTFCRIAAGELPAHRVLDDPEIIAFLDRSPLFPGHCLVMPRNHVVTLLDLPEASMTPLLSAAKRIACALETALEAEGSFVAMNNKISQSVPHLHVHVVPRRKKDGLRGFFWPRHRYASDDEMARVAEMLRSALVSPA